MNTHHWIFLSPHLDDVALSCGGLVWDLTQQGQRVEIWSLIAGLPPDENFSPFAQQMHKNWGISGTEAILARRAEDQTACAVLGAEWHHFDWPDVIYRRDALTGEPIVNNDDQLFSQTPETPLVNQIAEMITTTLPAGSHLVLPMGLGNHVDHQVVVQAGAQVGLAEYTYADYPYIIDQFDSPAFTGGAWKSLPHHLGEEALQAWQAAVLCYTSQLSTFWRDEEEMQLALRNYLAGGGGRLWEPQAV
jgi:LmbE family N-acetylglucosaminyl deacetylase